MSERSAVTEVTFEDGYTELKKIVAEVDDEAITVHEMCEKFARGKGLEKQLRAYLDEQEGKLKQVEAGENLPEFRIIAPSKPNTSTVETDVPAETTDFIPAEAAEPEPPAAAAGDDIPF